MGPACLRLRLATQSIPRLVYIPTGAFRSFINLLFSCFPLYKMHMRVLIKLVIRKVIYVFVGRNTFVLHELENICATSSDCDRFALTFVYPSCQPPCQLAYI